MATFGDNYNRNTFLKHIEPYKNNIKTIFELGARDCLDSIFLQSYYNCEVHAFEANPESYNNCILNLKNKNYENKIKLNNYAVWNEQTEISFFPVINGNIGASSCYLSSNLYSNETYIQKEIKIPTITLQNYCIKNNINKIDLLFMDIQGSEYNSLLGLGEFIKDIKFIFTEALYKPLYSNAPLNDKLKNYLESQNFKLIETDNNHPAGDWWGDQLYINMDIK